MPRYKSCASAQNVIKDINRAGEGYTLTQSLWKNNDFRSAIIGHYSRELNVNSDELKGKEKTKEIVLSAQIRALPERQHRGKKEHERRNSWYTK